MELVKEADAVVADQNKAKLDFTITTKGKIKSNSPRNVSLILENDPYLKDAIKFNEFTENIDVVRPIDIDLSSWGLPSVHIQKGIYTDSVGEDLALYMEVNPDYGNTIFTPTLIRQAVGNTARDHRYNPVVDYFNDCRKKWDEKARIVDFFPEFLGVEKNEANTLIAKLFFLGIVGKGLDPSVKFDYVIDLVGGQGVGKTTLLRKMAPGGFYTDSISSFTEKDDFAEMRTAVIVNDDEMNASNKATFEETKKFITMPEFSYRPPYGRDNLTFKKKFVICRTTNEIKHLKDKSGDRRFLSLMCDRSKQVHHPVTDLDQELVDQLWGEAMWLYETTEEPFALTPDQNELLEESREKFLYTSALEDNLRDLLDNEFSEEDFITNDEMWKTLSMTQGGQPVTEQQKRKVRYYMEHLDWEVGATRKITQADGSRKTFRGFKRK